MNVAEVAARLGTTEVHVHNLVRRRRLRFVKVGHYLRFDPDEIDQWIEDQTSEVVT